MWTEVKIHLPDDALELMFPAANGGTHAYEARNITARLNDEAGKPLPNAFFHYDQQGRSMPGRPAVRFGSFQKGISVIGVGSEGVELVGSLAHRMRRMWSEHVGVPLRETRIDGETGIYWSPYPRRYLIHGLAVDVPQPWSFTQADWLSELGPVMSKAVVASILSEVESVHSDNRSLRDAEVLNELDPQAVGIVEGERLTFKPLNTGSQNKASIVVCRQVQVSVPFRLEGVWHVGRLPSRGFGLMREVRSSGVMEKAH